MAGWNVVKRESINSPEKLISQYFPKDAVSTITDIMKAESSGNPYAINVNKNGTKDTGLFQINDINIPDLQQAGIIKSAEDLTNAETNVKAAAYLHDKYGTAPWDSSKSKWGNTGWNVIKREPITPEQQTTPQRNVFGGRATLQGMADIAQGTGETALSIATGIPAWGLGLLGGIAKTLTSGDEAGKKTREDITQAFTYQPRSKSGQGAVNVLGTVAQPLSIPRNIATKLGGEQWGNVADVATAGLLPKAIRGVRKAGDIPYAAGKFLYRKNLAPAGTVPEAEALTKFGYEKNYPTTLTGWKKFQGDLDIIKRKAGQIIAKNEGKTVRFETMLKPLDELINKYAKFGTEKPVTNVRSLTMMKDQLTKTWLDEFPDGNIPIKKAQSFKNMLYKRSASAQGELQTAMTSEGRKWIGNGVKRAIEDAIPDMGVINRKMSPYMEFEGALDTAIGRLKNEKFSITNSIFNNNWLMAKLAEVFKKISPDHPYADRVALKRHLLKTASPAVIDFEEAFTPEKPNLTGKGKTTTNIPSQGFTMYDPYQQPPPTAPLQIGYTPEPMIRGKGMQPDIWSKPEAQYPADIMDIVGMRSGKVQVPNRGLLENLLRQRKK